MHTAQAGNPVANLGEYHGLRLVRKHWYRFLDVCVASTSGCQVQDAVVWGPLPSIRPELIRPMAQEARPLCRIGDP